MIAGPAGPVVVGAPRASDGAAQALTVLDAHARLGPGPDAAGRLLADLDRLGIGRAIVSAGSVIPAERLSRQLVEGGVSEDDPDNDGVLEACAASGGRLVPFHFANPHRGAGPYRAAVAGVRGLELSTAVHGIPLDDPRIAELVAVAGEAGHPVYLVCLPRPGAGVLDLVRLARRFPDVTFVLGHCGATAVDLYGLRQVAPLTNVLAETSCALSVVVGAAIDWLGPHRVVFGTEHPHQNAAVELTKLRELDLPPDVRRLVMRDNARRLIGDLPVKETS